MTNEASQESFDQWCIVELLSQARLGRHQVIAGRVTEQVIGGAAFVRVDVPGTGNGCPGFTKFLGNNAIYSMTPVSEEVARAVLQRYAPKPITVYMPELVSGQLVSAQGSLGR